MSATAKINLQMRRYLLNPWKFTRKLHFSFPFISYKMSLWTWPWVFLACHTSFLSFGINFGIAFSLNNNNVIWSFYLNYFFFILGITGTCVHDNFWIWNVYKNSCRWLYPSQRKLPQKSVEHHGLHSCRFRVSFENYQMQYLDVLYSFTKKNSVL